MVSAIQKLYNNTNAVQVVCPTGNSANLISGKTIHDFLKIPTNKKSVKELSTPDGTKGQMLQQNCKDLTALIVDERSLVGSTTMGWMEFHCKYGVNDSSKSRGGLPVVIFLGDDVQLPPVCDTPVYFSKGKSPASMHGLLVWKEFQHVVHMQTVIRQNNDQQQFKHVLTALRESTAISEDTRWLQRFQWNNLKMSHGDDLLNDMTENGLFVFPTHAAEQSHNMQQLRRANDQAPVARMSAVNTGPHSKCVTNDQCGGLQNVLQLCVGAKVMLTSNLLVAHGLFNGSIGTVIYIIYAVDSSPKDSLPEVVMVSFVKYTGPAFLEDSPTIVPITPVERRVDCYCHGCKRKQMPLRLGWGTTIHRCQGMTINE